MIAFLVTAGFAFLIYLVLTAGSGTIGLWSQVELIAGGVISLIVAAISRNYFCRMGDYRMANPLRWVILGFYAVIPFFIEMAHANIDVAYRVITGRIRPGIVKLSTGLETDFGVLLLANSITLTPGTLTVGIDEETNDLYVHMINIGMGAEKKELFEPKDVFALFRFTEWIRRIAE